MSLQADGNVAFEEIPVFGVRHDQSAMILPCIALSWLFSFRLLCCRQVYIGFNIFYQHIVHVDCCVVYNHHVRLCDVHLHVVASVFHVLFLSMSSAETAENFSVYLHTLVLPV